MDPNPKSFPILSYILGPKPTQPPATELVDIEQPPEPEPQSAEPDFAIKDPKLLSAMRTAVSEVVQARSVLEALGPRPDHEIVDAARAKLAELEAVGDDQKVEAEKSKYKAVVSLEEMHLAYEKMLKVAEEKLVRMYESGDGLGNDDDEEEEEEVEEEVNEEVVRVLQEATGNGLERVELAGKKLRILPEAFGRIHGLVVLNVSDNQLKALPDSIAGLQTLEELNVSSNILESLPDSIGLLQNLKSLNASGNRLSALPDTISACRSLVELDVSYNNLSYLPTNLGNELVNLQRLSIQLNKIRYLPTSVGEMKSLRILDAHFNELHGLPVTIGKLTNLEILNLGSNFADLKELPVTFGNLSNLRELDLSNNQIHALPDTFGLLEKLTKVNLDENPIAIPPLEVVKSGVEAIKAFMAKRRLDLLLEEEEKNKLEMQMKEPASPTAWLARSTSWLKSRVSDVSHNVAEFIGNAGKTGDPILDEER